MARAPTVTKEEKKLFELAGKGMSQDFVDSLDKFMTRPRKASISNINVQNDSDRGRTLLHYAAANGDRLMVKCLLANGARGEICDKDNFLPLHVAVWAGHREVAKVLLEKFPEVINARTADGSGVLHYCLTGNNCEDDDILFFISAGIDLSICNKAGESALLKAVQFSRLSQASLILKHCHETLERSVLMELLKPTVITCAKFGRLSILKECFDTGFDVNYVGQEGTALHMAVDCGRLETVQFLLLLGANPKVENFAGESVLSLLNSGKLRLSECMTEKMKRLVKFQGSKTGSVSASVSVPTTPTDGNLKLMYSFSVPAAPQPVPRGTTESQTGSSSDGKMIIDFKQQAFSDDYQELDSLPQEKAKKSWPAKTAEDGKETSKDGPENRSGDDVYMDMTGFNLSSTLTGSEEATASEDIDLIQFPNDDVSDLKYGLHEKLGLELDQHKNSCHYTAPVYGDETITDNVKMDPVPTPLKRQAQPTQKIDKVPGLCEELLAVSVKSPVPMAKNNIIGLEEYGSEEKCGFERADEPENSYNGIASVYGNERIPESSFGNKSEPMPAIRQRHAAQLNSPTQMNRNLNNNMKNSNEYSEDDEEATTDNARKPTNQRNAFSVINNAFLDLDEEFNDEYSECGKEEQKLNDELEPEESPYASIRMLSIRTSTRSSNSMVFSSDNDRNVDWEFIDDILSSVGIHARDSRFDPDLFASRIERTISEFKSPETISDWLWVLQLRHLEPLFLANGYDNILFIGPDVLTKDSLKFMGVDDEATIDKLLQSETVLRCMQVPKLDLFQSEQTTIGDWLQVLHLSQYEANFTAAGCYHISQVTDAWQLALGINRYAITLLGHRRRLLASLNVKELKTQLKTFLRQSQIAQQEGRLPSVQEMLNEKIAAVDKPECRGPSISSEGGIVSKNTENTLNRERCVETTTIAAVAATPLCEQDLETFSAQQPEREKDDDGCANENNRKDDDDCSKSVGESIDSDPRSTMCKSITFGELNKAVQELEKGNEITLVADSSTPSATPSMDDNQSHSSDCDTLRSIDSNLTEENNRNSLNVTQVIEEYKSKRDEPVRKRTFSNLGSLKTSSFHVGFLGVNSFDGIEPSEKSLLMACRNRLSKGVNAVPLVTIQINFSCLRLLDPKGNISMEHAITNVQCAAMSSDVKTFAYVVIERKPVASSWCPLNRRNDSSCSESATTCRNVEKIPPFKASRMCYIFQALKDGEGQKVMAAMRSSFEAAFAFVSSMEQNNNK